MHACTHARTNERTNKQTRAHTHTHTLQNGAYVESKVGQPPQHGKIRNTVGGHPTPLQPTEERKKANSDGTPLRGAKHRVRGERNRPSFHLPTHPPTNQTKHQHHTQTDRKHKESKFGRPPIVCVRYETRTRSGRPSVCY